MSAIAAGADYSVRMYALYEAMGIYSNGRPYRPKYYKGVVLDKGTMAAVNKDMGHGAHRNTTLFYSYMSYGEMNLPLD